MRQTGYAYFVRRPRVLADLRKPHLLEQERPYEVIGTVKLGPMDYENFTTDMLADRQFLVDNGAACSRGEVWKCLLVQRRGRRQGVLVLPEDGCFVGYAAFVDEE